MHVLFMSYMQLVGLLSRAIRIFRISDVVNCSIFTARQHSLLC